MEPVASCETVMIMTHDEFAAIHPHPPKPLHVDIDRQKTPIDNISEQTEDAAEPMQVNQATAGRTLRKRKEKVPKHLKRGANDKEMENFRKMILRIPLDEPFEEAYFTHKLWMFFREPRKLKRTLGELLCLIGGIDYPSALCDTGSSVSILPKRNSGGFIRNLEVQIGNSLVLVDFHVLDIKLNWNSSLLLRRAFMTTVGATGYMEIGDNLGFIAAFHCDYEADEESDIEASFSTQLEISIDEKLIATIDNELETPIKSDHANEIDYFLERSIISWKNDYYQPSFSVHTATPSKRKMSAMEPDEYDEDYKEEATIEYRGLAMEEAEVLKRSHETRGETSIDGDIRISIDTHHGAEPDARAKDSASIDKRGQPSIDKWYEFGQRAYNSKSKILFHWEKKGEYRVYRDEHGFA
ncbi:hypothetical protein F2Q68_00034971 [Brassica cretica]|uniref:Aspartic peptidase DDI1-type domain-containing protein n=1 Tax=Brassica cretica TaxID=69181 RepID=A0A8S9H259_BRACR|nr:hypothetical protein F2Q68_00034971 [Brassica cretica]